MGKKKSLSTAELLARDRKSVEVAAEDSWEAAAALLAEEQAAANAIEEAQKAAARLEKAEQGDESEVPQPSAADKTRKKKKGKRDDTTPVVPPVAAKSAMEQKRDDIRRKVEEAQKARAAAMRSGADPKVKTSNMASDDTMVTDNAMPSNTGSREHLAAQRRAAAKSKAAAVQLEAEKPILAEATPSVANQQQPDETFEEWDAVGISCGGFARTAIGYHPGVSCDRSGKVPIVGVRFQLKPECLDPRVHPYGYDVCEAVWERMPPEEQQTFLRIMPSHTASDEVPLLQPLKRHFAYQSSGL